MYVLVWAAISPKIQQHLIARNSVFWLWLEALVCANPVINLPNSSKKSRKHEV